jgi:hypothetical protein
MGAVFGLAEGAVLSSEMALGGPSRPYPLAVTPDEEFGKYVHNS